MQLSREKKNKNKKNLDLTQGSIIRGLLAFAIPMFLGQLLQQLYNMADAWVVGNFADNNAFAAVSSGGSIIFLIIGFFNGISIGGGVVISRYFGAKDEESVEEAIHTNFLFGLIASILGTIVGLILVPQMLVWMKTPKEVMPSALLYFRIYFGGVSTIIMYNICMAIMRALGDSLHPLYYLVISSVINVLLDLLFVAGFNWGVTGAAAATVIAQGISCVLCIIRMTKAKDYTRLCFRKLKYHAHMMKYVLQQGVPTGVQNSVISIGNVVIQANINAFGAYAMSGHGAYSKIEGLVFLPITCISMALPTFVSQNLGAKQPDRAKKGAIYGIICGMIVAELVGVFLNLTMGVMVGAFTSQKEAIAFGVLHTRITAPFYFLVAFSHCAAGALRGLGKAFIPMVTMLAFWCGFRILYVSVAIRIFPVYNTIAWAYPITWTCSSIVFLMVLLRTNWKKAAAAR